MSVFYDLASLVLVPSGYKASKVYAQKPLTTDGQLAFSRASDATRVNSAGLIETVSSNVPRLDYQGSTCPKLLLEPQRTNLALYSEQLDNASGWIIENTSVTANAVTSPSGYTDADTLTAAGNFPRIRQNFISLTDSTNYTISVFAKAGTAYVFNITADDKAGTGTFGQFNLNTGAVADGTGTITSYGNGWYRCTHTFNSSTGISTPTIRFVSNAYGTTGGWAGTNTIHAWGAQMEAGAYATSYIPTTSAAVTRLADAASKTGISALTSSSEYTLFWEGSHIPTGIYNSFATFYNSANVNQTARFYRNNTNNEIRAAVFNNLTGLSVDIGSGVTAQALKCALRVKAGDYALFVNGTLVGTNTNALAPASTLDSVNLQYYDSSQSFDQKTGQVLFFKTGLTNAQLAELTAL